MNSRGVRSMTHRSGVGSRSALPLGQTGPRRAVDSTGQTGAGRAAKADSSRAGRLSRLNSSAMAIGYEQALAQLYQASPERFVAERKRLAVELKAAGDKAAAAALTRRVRPPISAWAVNQLWWQARDAFEALFATAARQRSGDLGAASAHRSQLAQLRGRAAELLQAAGHPTTESTLRRVVTTLGALAAAGTFEPDTPGALSGDRDPPGFDALVPSDALVPPPHPVERRAQEARRPEAEAKRKEAEAQQDEVEVKRKEAEVAQREAEAKRKEAAQREAEAKRREEEERRRVEAEQAQRRAEQGRLEAALHRAQAELGAREHECAERRDALRVAERALELAREQVAEAAARLEAFSVGRE